MAGDREEFERRLRRLEQGVERAAGAPDRLRRQLGEAESRGAGDELGRIIEHERRNIENFASELLDNHPKYPDRGIIRFTAIALVGMERLRERYPDDLDSDAARAIWGKCPGFSVDEVIGKISGFVADRLNSDRELFPPSGLGDDEPEPDLGPGPAPARGGGPSGSRTTGPLPRRRPTISAVPPPTYAGGSGPPGGGGGAPAGGGRRPVGGGSRAVKCSSCGATLTPGSTRCEYCGNQVFSCPNCKGPVNADDTKCPSCSVDFRSDIRFVSDREAIISVEGNEVGKLLEKNGFTFVLKDFPVTLSASVRWRAESRDGEVVKDTVDVHKLGGVVNVGVEFGGKGYRGNRILTGYVLDSVTKDPVPDATVSSRSFSGTTDRDGYFEISGLDITTYKINVKAEDYIEIKDKEVEIGRYSRSTNIELLLTPSHTKAIDAIEKKHGIEGFDLLNFIHKPESEWRVDDETKKKVRKAIKDYDKYKESVKAHTGKEVPHIKLPELAKKPVVELGRILGALSAATAGFVISSIVGIPIFTYAFLCFAAYVVLPGEPHYLQSVQREINGIRSKYQEDIRDLLDRNEFEDAADLSKVMETELEAAKSLGEFKLQKMAQMPQGYVAYGVKQILKIVGAGLLLIGVYTSGFPGATLAAVAGGFIAYFSFIVQRSIPEEKEKK